jgi:carboxymethylenebutenolidase
MSSYINVDTPTGTFHAYVAKPTAITFPAVVVLQEIFGVNADLRTTCDELASRGYLAISPDLFWRMEPGVDMSDQTDAEWKKGMDLYTRFDFAAGLDDIAATIAVAKSLPGATGKVGVMGYCLGGLLTFIASAHTGVDASVVYYGGGTEQHLSVVRDIKGPLLMHLGEEDEYIDHAARASIVAALAGIENARVFTYPGCRHAFARHKGAHYDPTAANLANARTAKFLDLYLKGEGTGLA